MDISLEREYELKRISIQRSKEEFLKLAYEKYPRFKEISTEIKNLGMQSLKLAISREASSKEELKKIQDKIKKLEDEKESLIKKEKIVLEPEYSCKECKDTGYIIKDNVITNCTCFKQKKIDQYYNKYNSIRLKDETFDKFDINLYSDKANEQKYGSKLSPKENIQNILDKSKKFINDDSIQNLLFIGNTGIGKTFLSRMYCQ